MRLIILALLLVMPLTARAEPNSLGQTGMIHMPDGRVEPDGTMRAGITYMAPYGAVWGSVTLVPWLEFSGRFTRIDDVPAFGGRTAYGDYKDKAFDFKIRLFEETDTRPALAVGRQDFHGTAHFAATFIAASKRFSFTDLGQFDLTLGWGDGRIDGAFGGIRWYQPWVPNLALVAEYDGFGYETDFHTRRTGSLERRGGFGLGVEYRYGWMFGQLAHQDGHFGVNLGVSVPLQQRTFAAKTAEPQPVALELERRPVLAEWQANDPDALMPMVRALGSEGFIVSRVLVDGDRIDISMHPGRMSTIGRAAGRAARVVAGLAPAGIRRLDLTLTDAMLPVITYSFADLAVLRAWLTGSATPEQLQATLSASYVDAAAHADLVELGLTREDVLGTPSGDWQFRVGPALHAFPTTVYRDIEDPLVLRIRPINFGFVFNDPNGVVKYELYSLLTATQWLAEGLYVAGSLRLTLTETISDTLGRSNSLLPHVRSDFVEYRLGGGRMKLDSLYLSHLYNPRDRVYTWATAGIYEEMYAGVGGEVLYLPETGNWAVDFAAHAVRQRDYDGHFGFLGYQTVTALAGFHYRFPRQGVTLTTRFGRFLARDTGFRFEARRRFLSGFEVGAWYTVTDANDITSPGTPGNPYHDKGVFVRYAIGPLLPRDSYASVEMPLSPWARDPGQMVRAPGGLYDLLQRRLLLNLDELGPWSDFGQ